MPDEWATPEHLHEQALLFRLYELAHGVKADALPWFLIDPVLGVPPPPPLEDIPDAH